MPVLALHGITGHGRRWRRLADEYLLGYRLIAPDLRGHGQSVRLPPWTLEQHAADLLAVLDRLGFSGLPVIGHSFGGAAAIHLARLAPQRVTRLVLLDPAIGLEAQFAFDSMSPWPHVFSSIEQASAWQRDQWADIDLKYVEDEIAENFVQIGNRWTPRYNHAAVITAWSEMCRAAQLPPPLTPTLLVPAVRARFVRPAFIQACLMTLQERLQLAEVDCGHMMQFERPSETAKLIMDFLGR